MAFVKTQNSEIVNMDDVLYIGVKRRNILEVDKDGFEYCGLTRIADPSSKCELIVNFETSYVILAEFYSENTALNTMDYIFDDADYKIPECEDHDYLRWERFGTFKPDEGKPVLVYRENTGNLARGAYRKDNVWCSKSKDSIFNDYGGAGDIIRDSDYWIYI